MTPRSYYAIVGPPVIDEAGHRYYGVCRGLASVGGPTPWEETPAAEVFKEYVDRAWDDLGEWDDFLPTLDLARHFQAGFGAHGYSLGILAVFPCESESDAAEVARLPGYLGLDVATTEPLTQLWPECLWASEGDIAADSLAPVWAVVLKYFRDRVNQQGLLARYEDAALFCRVLRAIQKIDAAEDQDDYHVLGVQEVTE